MKNVYFVRHGESVANATGIRLGESAQLTALGEKQALLAAARLKNLPLERIIASPFVRAHHTASIIAEHLERKIDTVSLLFIERRNPSSMLNRDSKDPEIEKVWDEIARNYDAKNWRHSDEENFEDLCTRAIAALSFLEALPEQHILVVTHGMFMKVLFAHVLLGKHMNGRIFWDKFVPIKTIANTGIVHLEHTENYHKTAMYWKVVSWNDHAHLLGG